MSSSVHSPAGAVAPRLTKRECAVLTAMASGLTQPAAARRLGISLDTFLRTRNTAVERLRAESASHAVALALAFGQIDPADVRARRVPEWPAAEHGIGRDAQVKALIGNYKVGNDQRAEAAAQRHARFRLLRAQNVSVEDAGVQLGIAHGTALKYERWRLEAIQQDRRTA